MTVKIFFCYAREDEALLNKLKTHLRPLQRQGLIDVWHDRDISAGAEWEQEISQHLNAAQIILLLVSPDFMDSDYCYGIEMKRAIERHERDEARVVPVILRPTLWRETSLGKLQALPKDAKPVIGWPNVDDALFSIAEGIRDIVIERRTAEEEQARKAREELAQPLVTSPEAAAQEVEERSEEIPLNPPAPFAQAPGERFGTAEALALEQASHIASSQPVLPSMQIKPPGAANRPSESRHPSEMAPPASPTTRSTETITPTSQTSLPPFADTISQMPAGVPPSTREPVAFGGLAPAQSDISRRHTVVASGEPAPAQRAISRRTVVLALVTLGAVAVGGTTWLALASSPHTPPLGATLLTYTGHSSPVDAVAWSPDGKRLASGSNDDTVQVWDATTGGNVLTYKGHSDIVDAVAWASDGKRIASGSADKTVKMWDATTGAHIFTYTGHLGGVYSVAWSPDGKRIASGGFDATVQVWDATTGGNVLTYKGHSGPVYSVAWSPDGKRIASGAYHATVQVWDATTGGNVLTYKGHSGWASSVAWSPEGKRIASGSADKTVQVWDATTGGNVLIYKGHSDIVLAVAWSPDGRRIASGSRDATVQVWDATTGGNVLTYKGHSSPVDAVAWSPDGRRIASGSYDNTVQVWSAG